jgi:uncharacterized damage-inducible protein DinB
MDIQSLKNLINYSYWAFDRIWPSIDQLNESQFVTDLHYSFGSIRNQIIHLVSGHPRWLHRLQMTEPVPHLIFEDFPTKSLVKNEWDIARKEMLDYINSLTDQDLNKSVPYQIQGRSIGSSNYRWEILLHLVNHSTDHRSQILAFLNTKFSIDTPEHDYIIYLWSKDNKI